MAYKQPQYTADGTRQESTNWRDEALSQRHRTWGVNCPATDIDLMLLEFNFGKPVALAEFKRFGALMVDPSHPTQTAVTALADGYAPGALPYFVAYYDPVDWTFVVYPMNAAARVYFQAGQLLTELNFVSVLYRMRNMVITAELKARLNNNITTGAQDATLQQHPIAV